MYYCKSGLQKERTRKEGTNLRVRNKAIGPVETRRVSKSPGTTVMVFSKVRPRLLLDPATTSEVLFFVNCDLNR